MTDLSKLPKFDAMEWGTGLKYSIKNFGDEWKDQAAFCNQPYENWKKSIFEFFIIPYITTESCALEIACGQGRWTEYLLNEFKNVIAVDTNQDYLNFCLLERFKEKTNLKCILKTEKKLKINEKIDFIWSYDSFVHFNPMTIYEYLRLFKNCKKQDAIGVIHHANKGEVSRGARAYMTKDLFAEMLIDVGLKIIKQTNEWGENNEYNCKLFGDCITVFKQQKDK
jgi:SAM-dependent methyltransferase